MIALPLALVGGLFVLLIAVSVFERLAARRLARQRREAARFLRNLLDGGEAAQNPFPVALARAMRVELAVPRSASEPAGLSYALERVRSNAARAAGELLRRIGGREAWRPLARHRLLGCLDLLEELPAPDNLPTLLAALDCGDPAVACKAALLLGKDPESFPGALVALATGVREGKAPASLFLAWALWRVGTAHPELLSMLVRDPAPAVRTAAILAAGTSVAFSDRPELRLELLRLVADALQDPHAGVRAAACESLGFVPSAELVEPVGRALLDADPEVRRAAVACLGSLREARVALLLAECLEGANLALAREVLRSLARLGLPGPPEELMLRAFAGLSTRSVAALRALCALGTADTARRLLPLLENPEAGLRAEVARTMAAIARHPSLPLSGTDVIPVLRDRLALEREPGVMAALIDALAASGDPRAAEEMMRLIPGSPAVVRERLIEGLALLDRLIAISRTGHLTPRAGTVRI